MSNPASQKTPAPSASTNAAAALVSTVTTTTQPRVRASRILTLTADWDRCQRLRFCLRRPEHDADVRNETVEKVLHRVLGGHRSGIFFRRLVQFTQQSEDCQDLVISMGQSHSIAFELQSSATTLDNESGTTTSAAMVHASSHRSNNNNNIATSTAPQTQPQSERKANYWNLDVEQENEPGIIDPDVPFWYLVEDLDTSSATRNKKSHINFIVKLSPNGSSFDQSDNHSQRNLSPAGFHQELSTSTHQPEDSPFPPLRRPHVKSTAATGTGSVRVPTQTKATTATHVHATAGTAASSTRPDPISQQPAAAAGQGDSDLSTNDNLITTKATVRERVAAMEERLGGNNFSGLKRHAEASADEPERAAKRSKRMVGQETGATTNRSTSDGEIHNHSPSVAEDEKQQSAERSVAASLTSARPRTSSISNEKGLDPPALDPPTDPPTNSANTEGSAVEEVEEANLSMRTSPGRNPVPSRADENNDDPAAAVVSQDCAVIVSQDDHVTSSNSSNTSSASNPLFQPPVAGEKEPSASFSSTKDANAQEETTTITPTKRKESSADDKESSRNDSSDIENEDSKQKADNLPGDNEDKESSRKRQRVGEITDENIESTVVPSTQGQAGIADSTANKVAQKASSKGKSKGSEGKTGIPSDAKKSSDAEDSSSEESSSTINNSTDEDDNAGQEDTDGEQKASSNEVDGRREESKSDKEKEQLEASKMTPITNQEPSSKNKQINNAEEEKARTLQSQDADAQLLEEKSTSDDAILPEESCDDGDEVSEKTGAPTVAFVPTRENDEVGRKDENKGSVEQAKEEEKGNDSNDDDSSTSSSSSLSLSPDSSSDEEEDQDDDAPAAQKTSSQESSPPQKPGDVPAAVQKLPTEEFNLAGATGEMAEKELVLDGQRRNDDTERSEDQPFNDHPGRFVFISQGRSRENESSNVKEKEMPVSVPNQKSASGNIGRAEKSNLSAASTKSKRGDQNLEDNSKSVSVTVMQSEKVGGDRSDGKKLIGVTKESGEGEKDKAADDDRSVDSSDSDDSSSSSSSSSEVSSSSSSSSESDSSVEPPTTSKKSKASGNSAKSKDARTSGKTSKPTESNVGAKSSKPSNKVTTEVSKETPTAPRPEYQTITPSNVRKKNIGARGGRRGAVSAKKPRRRPHLLSPSVELQPVLPIGSNARRKTII